MDLLIKTAIEAKNEDYGTQLDFVEYVSANVTAAQGFCFYITLWAKDLSSPDPEPKLYQTLVRKFRDEMHVHEFKLKPPQQETRMIDTENDCNSIKKVFITNIAYKKNDQNST
ncbi:hypothetical protein DY000_02016695 [Brassica cretica]|uniref:Cystatin domain-containing protein n=1 Tax=Brassica cretica TaxID=69181 RepID=A0ABQ7CLR8_BRACR|nr:hypothetical protein DY000_02016695 [Brassica cretica]